MAEPDLRFIGERLDRIQTELRELRALKTDVALLAERTGRVETKLDHMVSKVGAVDAKVRGARREGRCGRPIARCANGSVGGAGRDESADRPRRLAGQARLVQRRKRNIPSSVMPGLDRLDPGIHLQGMHWPQGGLPPNDR